MSLSDQKKAPIYVIGYPKSGTVWVTRLISDALHAPSFGFNQFGEKLTHSLDAGGFERKSDFEVLHCHLTTQNIPDQVDDYSKIIYVVRDFRDAVVSGFFYHYRIDERLVVLNEYSDRNRLNRIFWRRVVFTVEINKLIQSWSCFSGGTSWLGFFIGFVRVVISGKLANKLKGGTVGNWSDHINDWTGFSPNIVVIKYEDLLLNSYAVLKHTIDRLGLSVDKEKLETAIEQNSFEKKKAFFEQQNDPKNIAFMRKGIAGDWQRFLDKKMLQQIAQEHGRTMEKMGYL